ncbi:fascin domain-containing protein [Micromonospora sp. NPDC050417]|uniref:fascin domain-containing protein n=1 Tax=Micromonospora sp. NPDC050417 TaxID=3364280 RepID=UPI0037B5D422
MPLSVPDFAALGNKPITIQSTFFPNVYLRMDGAGVTTFTGSGGGKVNCQFGAGPLEKFRLRANGDGSYSFESVAFANVYLRMDGAGLPAVTSGPGGGTVNCQFGAEPYEKFKLHAQADGSFSFESATAFPNAYLRLVGSGVTAPTDSGSGIVNCQFNANGGGHEKFLLDVTN